MPPQDRIRLRRNPSNVATPAGTDDLYVNASGELVHQSPGGAVEVFPSSVGLPAALEGADLELGSATVDSLVLADADGLELDDNALAYRGGRLAIHDAVTTGGNFAEGLILRGAAAHDVSLGDLLATQKVMTIAEVPFPEALFTTGETVSLHFTGEVIIKSTLSSYGPATNPRLVFYFTNASGSELADPKGVGIEIASAAAPEPYTLLLLNDFVGVTVASTTLKLTGQTAAAFSRMRKIASDNTVTDTNTSINTLQTGGVAGANRNGTRQPFCILRCALVLPADPATANASGQVLVSADIRIQRTAAIA